MVSRQELNWNVPVINGQTSFFTKESYDKYSFYNENDLQQYLQKKAEEVGPRFKGRQVCASTESPGGQRSDLELSNTESPASYLEPGKKANLKNLGKTNRLSFLRKSRLTSEEQRRFLELFSKYSNSLPINPTEQERIEIKILQELQTKVTPEQEEFQSCLRQIAESSQHYNYLNPQARKYIEEKVRYLNGRVKEYPRYYETVDAVSLSIPSDLKEFPPLTCLKTLLELGCIPKVILPNLQLGNRPVLPVDYKKVCENYPAKTPNSQSESCIKQTCSQDWNAECLARKYGCNVVISSGGLKCLLDNQAPGFDRDWQLPFVIREYPLQDNGNSAPLKVIYIDKPFVNQQMTVREKNVKFHKVALKTLICHLSKSYKFGTKKTESVSAINQQTDKKVNKSVNNRSEINSDVASKSLIDDVFGCNNDMEDLETFGMTAGLSPLHVQPRESFQHVSSKSHSLGQKIGLEKLEERPVDSTQKGSIDTSRNVPGSLHVYGPSSSFSEGNANAVDSDKSSSVSIPQTQEHWLFQEESDIRPDSSISHKKQEKESSTKALETKEMLTNEKAKNLNDNTERTSKLPAMVPECFENVSVSSDQNLPIERVVSENDNLTTSSEISKHFTQNLSNCGTENLVSKDYVEQKPEQFSNQTTCITIASVQPSSVGANHQIDEDKTRNQEESVIVKMEECLPLEDVEHSESVQSSLVTKKHFHASPCENKSEIVCLNEVPNEEQITEFVVRKVRGRPRKTASNVVTKRILRSSPRLSRQDQVSCDLDQNNEDLSQDNKSALNDLKNLTKITRLRRSPRGLGRISETDDRTSGMTLKMSDQKIQEMGFTNIKNVDGHVIKVTESTCLSVSPEQKNSTAGMGCSESIRLSSDSVDESLSSTKLRLRSYGTSPRSTKELRKTSPHGCTEGTASTPESRWLKTNSSFHSGDGCFSKPLPIQQPQSESDVSLNMDVTMETVLMKSESSDTEDDCLVMDIAESQVTETMPVPKRRSKRIAAHGTPAESTDTEMFDMTENLNKRGRSTSLTKPSPVNVCIGESPNGGLDRRRSGRLANNNFPVGNRLKEDNFIECNSVESKGLTKRRNHPEDKASSTKEKKRSKGDNLMSPVMESGGNTSSYIGEVEGKQNAESRIDTGDVVERDLSHIAEIEEPSDIVERDLSHIAEIEEPSDAVERDLSHIAEIEEPSDVVERDLSHIAEIEEPSDVVERDLSHIAEIEEPSDVVERDLSHIAEIEEPSDLSEVDCANPVLIPLSPVYHLFVSTCPVIIPTESPRIAPKTRRLSRESKGQRSAVKHKTDDPLSAILNLQDQMLHQPSLSNSDRKLDESQQHKLPNTTKTKSKHLSTEVGIDNKDGCHNTEQPRAPQPIIENLADYKQPSDSDNVTYNLWSLAGKPILIRSRFHGYRRDANQRLRYLALSTKLEYQTLHGLEERSESEVMREWVSSYIRQNLPLIRARINALTSELMMVEETDALRCVPPKHAHLPPQSLQLFGKIITKLETLPVGSYMLSHTSGDAHCQIRKAKEANKIGPYDLHFTYTGFISTQAKLPTGLDWRPIDSAIILPFHWKQNRIPATFEPSDYASSSSKGSKNQHYVRGSKKHRRKAVSRNKSRNKKNPQNN